MIVLNDEGLFILLMVLFLGGISLSAFIDERIQQRKRSEKSRKDFHERQRIRDNTKYYNLGEENEYKNK